MNREPFLTRWSRRKLTSQHEEESVEPASPPVNQGPAEPLPSAATPTGLEASSARPELPSLDSISLNTGVAAFFRPEVEEGLRRVALKKLFSDPHFNIMDGLDVYIDDYSRKDPIPVDILDRLVRAQTWFRDQDEGNTTADEVPHQTDLSSAEPPPDKEQPTQANTDSRS